MKKHEYRCNRCLIIENKWISEGLKPLCSVACSKCGGLAIKLPVSESIDNLFKEIVQNPIDKSTLSIQGDRLGVIRIGKIQSIQEYCSMSVRELKKNYPFHLLAYNFNVRGYLVCYCKKLIIIFVTVQELLLKKKVHGIEQLTFPVQTYSLLTFQIFPSESTLRETP